MRMYISFYITYVEYQVPGVLFSIEREMCIWKTYHCTCVCFECVVQMSLYLHALQILLSCFTPEVLCICEEPMALIRWYKLSVLHLEF